MCCEKILASLVGSNIKPRLSSSLSSSEHQPTKTTTDTIKNAASLHIPVMLDEVLKLWLPNKHHSSGAQDNIIHLVDGTVGLGGHTLAALQAKNNVHILGIDRDESAIAQAIRRIQQSSEEENVEVNISQRVNFHHGSFSDISPNLLSQFKEKERGEVCSSSTSSKVDGILLDLGMNSTQIGNSNRGFTFRKHSESLVNLDMRFDTTSSNAQQSIQAHDIVNEYPTSELSYILHTFADEPYAKEIAADIVQWRKNLPRGMMIQSTLELRYIIEEAVERCISKAQDDNDASKQDYEGNIPREYMPATKQQKVKKKKSNFDQFRVLWHPPTSRTKREKLLFQYKERRVRHSNHVMRCFQALRIEVNNELEHIQSFFQLNIPRQCLNVGGRLVLIAFHPGEDRLVKDGMNSLVESGDFMWLTPEDDGLRPTFKEVKMNGRTRSARLRAVECIQ
jgi:16S rRNA C1402 N4-methylase RsmH